ncbi:hypothetical protein Q7P37_008360 [Cladosporium fusiforme]
MAKSKVKEPKVPVKGEKKSKAPKASETARAKPSQLSEEAVLESGSDSESGSSGGGSDTESEAEKRQNTKKPNAKKVKATEPEEPAVPSDDSSSSSSEEDKKAKKANKANKDAQKTNGKKRKSDESSSEDSDEELPDAPESKKAKTDSESSEEESSDEAEADKMDVDKPAPPPAGMVSSVPAKPYDAPLGYTSLDTSSRAALSNAALQGKQVWHITAPANLPISSLTEVALGSIQSGKPVLSHKGLDYVLSEDKGAQSGNATLVLLPEKDGYKPISQPVSKTLHLRQHVVLPNLSEKQASDATGSNAAGDVARPAVAAVRPQPKGMKMRYRPPGFGSGDPGRIGSGSESESEVEPVGKEAAFQFPKKLEATGSKKDKKEKKDKKKSKS